MSLTLILSLISAFVPLLSKYIGTPAEDLVKAGLSALATLITGWTSSSPTSDLTASLTALQTILTALAKDTSSDPTTIAQIEELDKDIRAAIAAYQLAEVATDPSLLNVPPPVA